MKVRDEIEQTTKNTWHSVVDSSDTTVIFVHGYFSSPSSCWRSSEGVFWPDLLVADPRIPPCSIFLAGYHTSIGSGDYGVQDCANEMIGALRRRTSDGRKAPLARRNIVFICHSLGGIVTRYVLEAFRDDFQAKNIGLCLMASPSLGSDYADTFGLINAVLRNRTGKQLGFFNPFLQDLDNRFVRFLDSRPPGSFIGAEAIEHKPIFLPLIPLFKPIVSKLSGGRYFSQRETLPDTNHSSIVKPCDTEHPSHTFLVDFFDKLDFVNTCVPQADIPKLPTSPLDVLFDVYEPRFEPFYLIRSLDGQIKSRAALQSLWLSGPSGAGKTCALKRYLAHIPGKHFHVCLSLHGDNATRENLIREFAETLSEMTGSEAPPHDYNSLLGFLVRLDCDDIVIYVDEISATHISNELIKLLYDMLITWKQRTDNRRLLLVVSSLDQPNWALVRNKEKLHELFAFELVEEWTADELTKLCRMIIRSLNTTELEDKVDRIVSAAKGSPRFIKTVFRTLIFQGNSPDLSAALQRASEQFIK